MILSEMIKIVCSIIPGNRNWCSLYLTCYIDRATLGFTLVVISRGEMSEFLPAMFTTVRLLSCMNASMSCELMLLGKLPSTIRTLKIKNKNEKSFSLKGYAQKIFLIFNETMIEENFNQDFSTTWGWNILHPLPKVRKFQPHNCNLE